MPADNEALVETARDRIGAIDILVNNAGMASPGHSVGDTALEELKRVLRVHVLGSPALPARSA